MAIYVQNKDGQRFKVTGSGGGGIKEIPIATNTIIGGIKSSLSSGDVLVDEATGVATVNDNVTMSGSGTIVLNDVGNPDGPHIIEIDDTPPMASDIGYDNSESNLTATTMQGAIDEVNTKTSDINNIFSGGNAGDVLVKNNSQTSPAIWLPRYYSNTNILDNSNLTFPVNQMGATSYSAIGYCIDRWYNRHCTSITVTSSGLELNVKSTVDNDGAGLNQPIEFYQQLLGKTVTCSVLIAENTAEYYSFGLCRTNSVGYNTNPILTGDATGKTGLVSVTGTLPTTMEDFKYLSFENYFGDYSGTVKIVAIKLELGETQTLAHQNSSGDWVLNNIPNYQEELLRCQRYYYQTNYYRGTFYMYNSTLYTYIPTPVPLYKQTSVLACTNFVVLGYNDTIVKNIALSTNPINCIKRRTNECGVSADIKFDVSLTGSRLCYLEMYGFSIDSNI